MGRNRQSTASGLSGAIAILGIVLALAGGGFNLPILFIALAVSSLVGSLGSGNPRAAYGGFMGFCWLLMLALFFITGSWLWFLVGAALSSLLGALFKPMIENMENMAFFGQNVRNSSPQQPYQPEQSSPVYQPPETGGSYEQGYQAQQREEHTGYQEGSRRYTYPPVANTPDPEPPYPSPSPDLPEAQYPQQLPPQ